MTFLPIVERELRETSRRPITYYTRSGAALLMLGLALWVYATSFYRSPSGAGQVIFATLTGFAMFICLFCGLRATADCISKEKRDGTLGLLFLTDLRGYDVVLGKLAANSLGIFYALLAIVPVLGLPLLMGGVSPGEFARVSLVCVNTMLMSLSVGILVSTLNRDARKAIGAAALILILLAAAAPAVGAILQHHFRKPAMAQPFYWASPWYGYMAAFDANKGMLRGLYASMSVAAGVGIISLIAACWFIPRSWQDRAVVARSSGFRAWCHRMDFGTESERVRLRGELLDVNPFLWLTARGSLRYKTIWLVLFVLAALWLWGYYKFKRDWLNEGIFMSTAFILHVLLKGWVTTEASRSLADQREQGTLELLLSTPLSVREILRGQALALQRMFLGPTVLILGLDIILFMGCMAKLVGNNDRDEMMIVWLAGVIMLLADIVAIYWVGMWQGLVAPNAQKASTATAMRILVLPWIIFLIMISMHAAGNSNLSFGGVVSYWFFISLVVDFAFGAHARNALLEQFREVATRRFERRSFWQRLFSPVPSETMAADGGVPPLIPNQTGQG